MIELDISAEDLWIHKEGEGNRMIILSIFVLHLLSNDTGFER